MDHRGVSPDSSTHISEKNRKSKKRKHKQKTKSKHKKVKSPSSETNHKKSKKHKSSHFPANSHESDEEVLDVKPLSGYVNNKKELHKEMFSIISKKEVKELLPPLLKKLKFKEFKSLCLDQLEVMSQKRLRHIIAGQEMVSSSSSDESESKEQPPSADNEERESMIVPVNKSLVKEQVNTATCTKDVEEKQLPSRVSILEEMSLSPNQDEINELIEPETQQSEQPVQQEELEENEDSPAEIDDQSLVMAEAELKELEFRARALKSLVIARERQQKFEKQKENIETI